MKVTSLSLLILVLAAWSGQSSSPVAASTQPAKLTVTAVNKLKLSRPGETIELTAQALEPLGEKDLMKLHVHDSSGKEVISQAVDTDYDD